MTSGESDLYTGGTLRYHLYIFMPVRRSTGFDAFNRIKLAALRVTFCLRCLSQKSQSVPMMPRILPFPRVLKCREDITDCSGNHPDYVAMICPGVFRSVKPSYDYF